MVKNNGTIEKQNDKMVQYGTKKYCMVTKIVNKKYPPLEYFC